MCPEGASNGLNPFLSHAFWGATQGMQRQSKARQGKQSGFFTTPRIQVPGWVVKIELAMRLRLSCRASRSTALIDWTLSFWEKAMACSCHSGKVYLWSRCRNGGSFIQSLKLPTLPLSLSFLLPSSAAAVVHDPAELHGTVCRAVAVRVFAPHRRSSLLFSCRDLRRCPFAASNPATFLFPCSFDIK